MRGTPGERKVLMVTALLAVAAAGTRAVAMWRGDPPLPAETRLALVRQQQAVDSAARSGRGTRRRSKGAVPAGPPVDVDRAGVAELEQLPGVGPGLAQRIVASRDSFGPFGSLEELEQVHGVGPKLAVRLRDRVTFSLTPRPQNAMDGPVRPRRRPSAAPGR